MADRDEFPQLVKDLLAKRVGTLCSNPQCSTPTYGPETNPAGIVNKGVAAHITAASEGGPRYNPNMSSADRKSIENGIWLCESCAKVIDSDLKRYTVEVLKRWKSLAEERARKALENPRIVNFGPDFADTILVVTIQQNSFYPKASRLPAGQYARRPIKITPISAQRDLLDLNIPLILGEGVIPPGFCLITLTCQNQGTGVDQNMRMGLHFNGEEPAILRTNVGNNRVNLSGGGLTGASFATFFIRELLPSEIMYARVIAKNALEFNATLWTQQSGDSPEVFVYKIVIGDEEHVSDSPWNKQSPSA